MKAVIYGAGNIGRGFIGQLMSQSGYEVVFLDIDKAVLSLLNAHRRYPITIVSDEGNRDIWIENVRAVDSSDTAAAAAEIVSADVMATSVGVNVLRYIAPVVASAIERRIEAGAPPLNILLCENLMDADKYFRNELTKHLSESAVRQFSQKVGLVEASIGRMVPVIPKIEGDNPLRVYVEEFDILHLDKDGFTGEIPAIKNIVPYSPFSFYMHRKLYIHNMTHAVTAYLGAVKGYEYISAAINDTEIKYIVQMCGTALVRAIAKDHPAELDNLFDFLYKLLYRFCNSQLKDTVARVAKDPVRKLHKDDRLVGAHRLCAQKGIDRTYLNVGIAALLCFKDDGDASSLTLQKEISRCGIEQALRSVSLYDGFDAQDISRIRTFYQLLKGGKVGEIIGRADRFIADGIELL